MDMARFQEACSLSREDASSLPRRVLDVGFLGATLPNLTAALALCSHYEGARIQIFEKKEDISSEDFVVAISTDAWKALTVLCPLVTRALMSRGLLLNYENSSEESLIQAPPKKTVYTTSGRILGLLSSVLPAGTVTTGIFPAGFVETSDGFDLAFEDGSLITAKLLIDTEVSSEKQGERSSNYAEVMLQVSGSLSHLSGFHWIDHQTFATCHDLGGNVHIVTAVVGEHGVERSAECVRQFPEIYGCLMGSSVMGSNIRWLSCAAEQYSGNWRSTNLSNYLCLFPYISVQMLENVLGLALVLKNSICEKGLTPAALREVERLSHNKLRAQGFVAQQPSKLFSAWGLVEQQVAKAATKCLPEDLTSSPPKSMNDIALAKGLVYPGHKGGMGWRIMS